MPDGTGAKSVVTQGNFGRFGGPLGARPADPNLDMLPAGDCDCHVAIVALESDSKVPGTGWLSPYS